MLISSVGSFGYAGRIVRPLLTLEGGPFLGSGLDFFDHLPKVDGSRILVVAHRLDHGGARISLCALFFDVLFEHGDAVLTDSIEELDHALGCNDLQGAFVFEVIFGRENPSHQSRLLA